MKCLWGRRIAAGMSLALASYGLAVASPSSPLIAPAQAAENVSAAITDLGSPVLTLNQDLNVHVRVNNPTDGAVNVNRIELRAQNNVTNSRQRVLNFLYGDRASLQRIAVLNEDRKVAAHSAEDFIVTVPANAVSQLSSDWGPLGIEANVDLTSGQDLTDRSMLVLPPRGEVKKAPTAFLLPLNFSSEEITSLANTNYFSFSQPLEDTDVSPEESSTPADETSSAATTDAPTAAGGADSAGSGATDANGQAGAQGSETSTESSKATPAPSGENTADTQGEGTAAAQASTLQPTQECRSRLCTMLKAMNIPGVTAYIQPNSNYSPVGITLEAMKEFVAQSNTQLLMSPYADVDAHALANLDHEDVLKNAFSQASTSAALLGVPTQTNIALTAPGVDEKTAENLAAVGYGALIVSDEDAQPKREQRFTASARIDLPLGNSSVAALRIDSDVSSALSGTLPLRANEKNQGAVARKELSALDSRQLALALSAATYRERPNVQRSMLIAVDRAGVPAFGAGDIAGANAESALSPEHLGENVHALLSAPWVNGANVSQLLAGQAADVEYEALPSESAVNPLKAADYATARDARDSVNRLASLTSYSQQVADRTEGSFERLLAYAWRGDGEARRKQITAFSQAAANSQASLSIAPSSTINVISQTTDIPVHVRNDLPVDVGVVISMRSYDARLRSGNDVAVRIPANSSKSVTIPVRAVGSGDVTVVAELKTPDGTTLGSGRTIHVRVRADWENWGTGIVAVFFLGVLGFGVWRSLQRRKQSDKGRPA